MSIKTVKKQLIWPLVLALLAIIVVALSCVYWLQRRHIAEAVQTRLTAIETLIPNLLHHEGQTLRAQLDFLSQDEDLQQAWLRRDREELYRRIQPLFAHLRAEYGVTHFYFVLPDRRAFLRVHEPLSHGDLVDRFTMVEAARTGKTVSGIELGQFGTFTLRAVMPWRIDGEVSGFLELGKEVAHLTPTLKKILRADLVVTIAKSFLDRREWEMGMTFAERQPMDWDTLPNSVIVDQTLGQLPPSLLQWLHDPDTDQNQQLSFRTDSGLNYLARIAPLHDAGSKKVGQIVLLYNMTAEAGYLRKAWGIIAGISIIAGGVLLILFVWQATRIDRTLDQSFADLKREIMERRRTEQKLQEHQEQLEELVRARTAELKAVNERLQEDIEDRKQMESVLRESEQKFRSLFESANESIFIIDPDNLRILEANRTASKRLGYSGEELKRLSITDIYPQEEPGFIRKIFRNILEKGQITIDRVQVTRDGVQVPVEVSSQVIEYEGRKAVLSFGRDITDRIQSEAARQRAQKLESVGILAGGIAHDFNNLLTAILGNITLARIYLEPGTKAVEKLALAEQASMRARDITQQLLTFAKGGAPVKKPASLAPLVREPVQLALTGSRVRSEYSLPADLWAVEVDEGQLRQVLSNLTINAVQAMPAGGTLKVAGANEMLDVGNAPGLPAGRYVRIDIQDQGTGIPEQDLDKIFDPYFTTKERGSGLGLAISFSIVKNHGGHLGVASKVGEGTTFSILLPAADGPAVAKEEKGEALRGTGRVLVMDDEETVRDVAAGLLISLGYEPDQAADGTQVIELYRQALAAGKPYAAVITDLTVPGGMGGQETLRQLLEIDPEATVIVSSGYANDPIMSNYAEYGFKGVIPKPYKVHELGKTMRKVTGEREG